MKREKVALLFGGRSDEHEVSIMSARSVYENIDKRKYEVIPFAISKKGFWNNPQFSEKILQDNYNKVPETNTKNIRKSIISFLEKNIDIAFPLIHGPYGEDGRIQGFLEIIGIPYVGAGVLGSALAMDKITTKRLLEKQNIPQARYTILNKDEFISNSLKWIEKEIISAFEYPVFVKPSSLGSSIGISKVNNSSQLQKAFKNAFNYDNRILIEENIKGREIECSVLGNKEIIVSKPGEIKPVHEFYDYDAKYKEETGTELIIPVEVPEKIKKILRELSIKVYKLLNIKGMARVDFFYIEKENRVLINEINSIPGFTIYSMYPQLWEVSGLSYMELINKLLKLAKEKGIK